MCPKEDSVRPKLSMGLLEAGCLLEDSHSQLGLASIKDISLECFFNENVSRHQPVTVLCDCCWTTELWWPWEPPLPRPALGKVPPVWNGTLKWENTQVKEAEKQATLRSFSRASLWPQDKQLLLSSCQTGLCVLSKLLDFKTQMSESHFQFENFWC